MTTAPPEAWADLLEAIALLAKHPSDDTCPVNCFNGRLEVMADPDEFTGAELARLEELSFRAGKYDGTFCSYRFGSA
jgi:hypothetical protein